MPNSMLDWPEATQTSPTKTSLKVRMLFPVTVRVPASLAGSILLMSARHVPLAAAAVFFWPLKVTVISSPGCPAPDGQFCFFLQDHVIAKNDSHANIRPGTGKNR